MMTRQSMARAALRNSVGLVAASVSLCVGMAARAAQQPAPNLTKEDLAQDNTLFLTFARSCDVG